MSNSTFKTGQAVKVTVTRFGKTTSYAGKVAGVRATARGSFYDVKDEAGRVRSVRPANLTAV